MSTLKADTIVATDGTSPVTLTKQEAAKLRCRYNQATASLETGSLNASSVSDDATGEFTVSVTSAMSDALYSVSGLGGEHGGNRDATWLTKKSTQRDYSTSAVPAFCCNYAGGSRDSERNSIVVFGDLA